MKDIGKIIDESKRFIQHSTIFKISDIHDWSGEILIGNRLEKIAGNMDDNILGNCHMVPNHALIIMSLLFGMTIFKNFNDC